MADELDDPIYDEMPANDGVESIPPEVNLKEFEKPVKEEIPWDAVPMIPPGKNKPEWVKPGDFDEALKSGLKPVIRHFSPGEFDPETGDPMDHWVEPRDLKEAAKAGLVPEHIYHARQQVEEAKQTLPTTELGAAARGVANWGSQGLAPAIGGGVEALRDYLTNWQAKRIPAAYETGKRLYQLESEADKAQNPKSYATGAGAGAVASMPFVGAKSVLGAAGLMGGLGAAEGLAGGTDYPVPGEEQMSPLKKAAIMGGAGALGGAAVTAGAKAAGPYISEAMQNLAQNRAVKSVQPTINQAFQRIIARLPGGSEQYGKELLERNLVQAGDSVPDIGDKALALKEEAGDKIGSVLKELDSQLIQKNLPGVDLNKINRRIEDEVVKPLEKIPTQKYAMGAKIRQEELKPMEEMAGESPFVGFETLHKWRSELDKKAYNQLGLDKPLNDQLQKIRKIIEEELYSTGEKMMKEEAPKLLPSYTAAKRAYQVAKVTADGAALKSAKFAANRSISLTDYFAGGAGADIAGHAAEKLDLPPVLKGVIGTAGGAAGALANKLMRERGNPVIAGIAADLAKRFANDPNPAQKVLQYMVQMGLFTSED